MKDTVQVGLAAVCLVLTVSVCVAWRMAQQDAAKLQVQLKVSQDALAEASKRQQSRDADLKQALSGIQKQKAAVQKPADIVKALPAVLPLPTPLVIATGEGTAAGVAPGGTAGGATSEKSAPASSPSVRLPAEDLKPLYDFALDCKACQDSLRAAQADLKDEQLKSQAVGKERDAAVRAAKGGSALRRVARAAKWFVVGAALGAAAAKIAR